MAARGDCLLLAHGAHARAFSAALRRRTEAHVLPLLAAQGADLRRQAAAHAADRAGRLAHGLCDGPRAELLELGQALAQRHDFPLPLPQDLANVAQRDLALGDQRLQHVMGFSRIEFISNLQSGRRVYTSVGQDVAPDENGKRGHDGGQGPCREHGGPGPTVNPAMGGGEPEK